MFISLSSKVRSILIIIVSGFFLLIDQTLKCLASRAWSEPRILFPNFGWQLYTNPGVAFGWPLPNSLTLAVSLPMLGLIGFLAHREYQKKNAWALFAWTLLFAGALSNVIDRIVYQNVIDYFVVGTSLINLSDVMIVAGLMLYLITSGKSELKNPKFKIPNTK